MDIKSEISSTDYINYQMILAINGSRQEILNNLTKTYQPSGEIPFIPAYLYVVVSVVNALIFVFGMVGNLLVVLVFAQSRSMRTPTNFFLLSLSIADILVLLFCQPAALMEFYAKDRWLIGSVMCKLVPLLENGALSVSIMTMLAVTAERYIAICHPFKRNINCTVKTAIKFIIVIWLLGFLLSTPFLVMTDLENALFYDGTPIKVCRTRVDNTLRRGYIIFVFVIFFTFPVFLLVFTYMRIIKQLVADSMKLFAAHNSRSAVLTLKLRKQVVRMLIIIIVLFFVSLSPIRVVTLWLIFTPTKNVVSIGLEGYLNLISFARIMMYLNSAGNPIIYNLTSNKFRAAFQRVLKRHSSGSSSISRRYAFRQKKQGYAKKDTLYDEMNLNPAPPCLIVRLLFYSEEDIPNNGSTNVIRNKLPLHIIFEEESSKKNDDH